jgi:hypothetical protein
MLTLFDLTVNISRITKQLSESVIANAPTYANGHWTGRGEFN